MQVLCTKILSSIYTLIKSSNVVTYHNCDNDSIREFQKLLNDVNDIKHVDLSVLRLFVYNMYIENPYRFIRYVSGTRMECLILWCGDIKSIVNILNIRNVVYIKKNIHTNRYVVSKYRSPVKHKSTTYRNSLHDLTPLEVTEPIDNNILIDVTPITPTQKWSDL